MTTLSIVIPAKNESAAIGKAVQSAVERYPDAQVIVVYAKTDPDAGPRGITAFIVDTASKGFKVSIRAQTKLNLVVKRSKQTRYGALNI